MSSERSGNVLDWFWGDTVGIASVIRRGFKVVFAVATALALHQGVLHWTFAPNTGHWKSLQVKLHESNGLLAQEKSNFKGEADVRVCLFGSWAIQKDLLCPPEIEVEAITGLGYVVIRQGADPTQLKPRRFFYTHESVLVASEVRIQASLQMLLRDIERQALNGPTASDVSLILCVGTREVATDAGCKVMSEIRTKLSDPKVGLDPLIDHIRVVALFFGPFHFVTFAVFIYALMESIGLYFRWVKPSPTLYQVADGELRPEDDAIANVSAFTKASVQSLGDKLFYQALQTAKRAGDKKRVVDRRRPSEASEAFAEVEVMSGVESYRHHLIDDASSRQEPLETLGDTMLKLAFMGTVYGISAALFAARQLDTADPVEKLLAKAEMYSGIGVGFGTTLTGIVLSIVAAQARSIVSGAWFYQIGRAYDLLAIFGSDKLLSLAYRHASELKKEESKSPAVINRDSQPFSNKRMAAWFVVILLALLALGYVVRSYLQ